LPAIDISRSGLRNEELITARINYHFNDFGGGY
jgi:transcription termination factor Rho